MVIVVIIAAAKLDSCSTRSGRVVVNVVMGQRTRRGLVVLKSTGWEWEWKRISYLRLRLRNVLISDGVGSAGTVGSEGSESDGMDYGL